MNNNDFDNDDIDFSIIAPDSDKPKAVDFSVNSLLIDANVDEKKKSPSQNVHSKQIASSQGQNGSFMRDLQKIEKQLSYESVPYNVYEPSELPNEFTGINEGKQQSTCTKTGNTLTKGASRYLEPQFKHLILDFKEENEEPDFKAKQNFQDYFGNHQFLTSKLQDQQKKPISKHSRKKKSVYKTPFQTFHEHSKSKPSFSLLKNSKSKSRLSTQSTKIKSKTSLLNHCMTERSQKSSKKSQISASKEKKAIIYSKRKKTTTKTKIKSTKKSTVRTQNQEIYSQYFGYGAYPTLPPPKSQSRSKSKGNKVIFSRKNVHINH